MEASEEVVMSKTVLDAGHTSSVVGMVADEQWKGLLLALSSSAFIGASFIIKKKGLKKAGASGMRAGTCLKSTEHTTLVLIHTNDGKDSLSYRDV